MDIFNRQPSIAEDTVQYSIYPSADFSDKASVTALAACLTDFVNSTLLDFIWHRDAFEVKVVSNPDNAGSWILEGRLRVGDCIDDEWCTVWLLREVSSKWDVAVSVYDSDGEFLLIEAAEALPAWVKPSNSENRVWIYKSRLHLLPLVHVSSKGTERRRQKLLPESDEEPPENEGNEEFIATVDALKIVRDPQRDTLAPSGVEKLVWDRISSYPSALKSHMHVTKAYIPQDIVRALMQNPPLVQKAVEAFYTRDSIQLRAAYRMSRFPPNTSVLASVRMTRTAYAQLSGQKLYPPKIFGQWKESEGSDVWRWKDTGMKIAIGFEMLYQESKNRRSTQNLSDDGMKSSTKAAKDALQRDPDYQKYIQTLISANYFKGELQGSAHWNLLEDQATLTFVQTRRADDTSRPSFASQVDAAVAGAKELSEPLDRGEDSEEWLNINAEDFDQMLENARTKGKEKGRQDAMDVDKEETVESTEDALASKQATRLKELANKVENFIEGEGDIEGAIFEDEEFSDEPFSDAESSGNDEPDADASGERTAEQQLAMDKLVPALEPSEYGKMPPIYHDNSQRVAPTTVLTDNVGQLTKPGIPDQHKTKPVRAPILPRDEYDGVDSDDETDVEDVDSDEEGRPQVVGEIEVDMQQEEAEFIEFSKQALGISDAQWAEIVKDRKQRGAFLPLNATETPKLPKPLATEPEKLTNQPWMKNPGQARSNPNLDSFDAVMNALDEVLSQKQTARSSDTPKLTTKKDGKEKKKATIEDEMAMEDDSDFDVETAMDAELKQLLDSDDLQSDEPLDYNLIKNFLESFKSQGGLSGPVSNLAGRLAPDLRFPRDST